MLENEFFQSIPHALQIRIRALEEIHKQLTSEEGWGKNVYAAFWEAAHQNIAVGATNQSKVTSYSPALSDLAYLVQAPQIKDALWPREDVVLTTDEGPQKLSPGITYKMHDANRNFSIITSRFGFDSPPETLQVIAEKHFITRERVRQIVLKQQSAAYHAMARTPATHIPVLRSLTMLLITMAKAYSAHSSNSMQSESEDDTQSDLTVTGVIRIADYLVELGLIRSKLELSTIMQWYENLIDDVKRTMKIRSYTSPEYASATLTEGLWFSTALFGSNFSTESDPHKVVSKAHRAWRGLLEALTAPLPMHNRAAADAIVMIKLRGAFRVVDDSERQTITQYLLDQGHLILRLSSWIVRLDKTRNTLRDGIGRLLCMVGPLSVNHIREALAATKHGRREYSLEMTDQELEEILQSTEWCTYEDGKWAWAGEEMDLGEKDRAAFNALRQLPRVFFYAEAVQATRDVCSIASLSFFLSGPYGFSPKHNMYCIRGSDYNVFDLARTLPRGTVAHLKATSFFISHDPDIIHVEAPENWNSQVSVGQFYDGDWTLAHGRTTRPGKAARGVLFSGLLPMIKLNNIGPCFDLNISTEARVIRISKCISSARHAARGDRNSQQPSRTHRAKQSSRAVSSNALAATHLNLWTSPGADDSEGRPSSQPKPKLPSGPSLKPSAKQLSKVAPLARRITKLAPTPATRPSAKPPGKQTPKPTVKPVAKSARKGEWHVYVPVRAQLPPIKQNGVARPVPKPPAKIAQKGTSRNPFAKLSVQQKPRPRLPNKRP